MINSSEYLERIVAGVHAVTTSGADVRWNEVINKRQFDVVIRFSLGTLSYLVVVEVKDRERKTPASDLEAFVTKAADQKANKAVFVTTAGFQSGAVEIAKRHGIEIFTVTFDTAAIQLPDNLSSIILRKKGAPRHSQPEVSVGEPKLIEQIADIALLYEDGKRSSIPDEQSQATYYVLKTKLQDGGSLGNLIEQYPFPPGKLGDIRQRRIDVTPPQDILPPDEYFFPAGKIHAIEYTATTIKGRPIGGNTLIDPGAFTTPLTYTNAITGEELGFLASQLPLGNSAVSPGNFYFTPTPLSYWYCADIQENKVKWYMIESFQNGNKINVTTTQDIKYSPFYIPVTDTKILGRLRMRLKDHLSMFGRAD